MFMPTVAQLIISYALVIKNKEEKYKKNETNKQKGKKKENVYI